MRVWAGVFVERVWLVQWVFLYGHISKGCFVLHFLYNLISLCGVSGLLQHSFPFFFARCICDEMICIWEVIFLQESPYWDGKTGTVFVVDCELPVDDLALNAVLIADHVSEEGQGSDIQHDLHGFAPRSVYTGMFAHLSGSDWSCRSSIFSRQSTSFLARAMLSSP